MATRQLDAREPGRQEDEQDFFVRATRCMRPDAYQTADELLKAFPGDLQISIISPETVRADLLYKPIDLQTCSIHDRANHPSRTVVFDSSVPTSSVDKLYLATNSEAIRTRAVNLLT